MRSESPSHAYPAFLHAHTQAASCRRMRTRLLSPEARAPRRQAAVSRGWVLPTWLLGFCCHQLPSEQGAACSFCPLPFLFLCSSPASRTFTVPHSAGSSSVLYCYDYFLHLLMCAVALCVVTCVWKSEANMRQLAVFSHVGLGDQTQDVRLGSKRPDLLRLLPVCSSLSPSLPPLLWRQGLRYPRLALLCSTGWY